jgi:predicted nucleotidyltransferase
MKYTIDSSQKEKLIEIFARQLEKQYKEIRFAYIFGSFISETYFSDIDLGIVLGVDLKSPLDFEIELENRLEKIAKLPVDVRVLNYAPISFTQNVFRTGRVILDKYPNIRADFEGRILKKYFDFAPYHRAYLQEVINAPV